MKKFSSHKGFTLVELMIVIAIIGILAAVLYPSLTGYLERTRDTNRQQAMNQLGTALGTYFSDMNGYPAATNNNCMDGLKTPLIDGNVKYLKALPKDPKIATNKINNHCTETGYAYSAKNVSGTPSLAQNYVAAALMEVATNGNMSLDAPITGVTGTYTSLAPATTSVDAISKAIASKQQLGTLASGKKAVFAVYNQ